MSNALIWADIPVTDMARAINFYSELLQIKIEEMPGTGGTVAIPEGTGETAVSFDLALDESAPPSGQGVRIYFDPEGDMDGALKRAEAAGGKIVQPAQDMGPMVGVIAFLLDSEGNTIGLRSPSAQAM